jgi:hypothetical protein
MLNAQDLSKAIAVLKMVSDVPFQTMEPNLIGKLKAEAFLVSLPLQYALEQIAVQVKQEKELAL